MLVISGASLSATIVTVDDWLVHASGAAPSQTVIARTQLVIGTGPAWVKPYTPVTLSMTPPQVSVASTAQVWPGPSTSLATAAYTSATSSVADVGAVVTNTGASLTGVIVTTTWPTSPPVPSLTL